MTSGGHFNAITSPRGKNRYEKRRGSEVKKKYMNKNALIGIDPYLEDPLRPLYAHGDSEKPDYYETYSVASGMFSER